MKLDLQKVNLRGVWRRCTGSGASDATAETQLPNLNFWAFTTLSAVGKHPALQLHCGIANIELTRKSWKFLRSAVQRNQLTNSERLILEVELRTGENIMHRGQGRPRTEA